VSLIERMFENFSLTIVDPLQKCKPYIPSSLFERTPTKSKFAYQNNKTLVLQIEK